MDGPKYCTSSGLVCVFELANILRSLSGLSHRVQDMFWHINAIHYMNKSTCIESVHSDVHFGSILFHVDNE
jgi:hypothetical protein